MKILQQIEDNFSKALKEKDELVVLVLRQLKTAISNGEIAKNREKLTEEELIKLLRSEVKKRKEATSLYQEGGRDELAKKEQSEIEIIEKYLPAQLGQDQVGRIHWRHCTKIGCWILPMGRCLPCGGCRWRVSRPGRHAPIRSCPRRRQFGPFFPPVRGKTFPRHRHAHSDSFPPPGLLPPK